MNNLLSTPYELYTEHKHADYQYSYNTVRVSNGIGSLDVRYSNGAKYQQVRLHSAVKFVDEQGYIIGGCTTNHHLPAAGLHGAVERTTSCQFVLKEEDLRKVVTPALFVFHRNEDVGPTEGEVSEAIMQIIIATTQS